MAISFNSAPTNQRAPLVAVEFDASKASQGPALLEYKALIIGQKLDAAAGVADTLYKVSRADDVIAIAGRGSLLHREAIAWFASNQSTEVWVGVLADDGAGVAASGTITIVGTATETATLALYMGGKRIPVAVVTGDDQTAVATAIAAAINVDLDLPVTATSALGVVTVTFRNDGEVGNDFDMRINYLDSDSTPAGISSVAIVAMASGATNPAIDGLITALGDTWFHVIVNPYTDATSLTALETELALRNGPTKMIDGVAIASASDTHANLTTLGNGRNSPHSCIIAQPGKNPLTLSAEYAAEQAAILAKYGAIDPARPFQTLGMLHAVPPADADLFTGEERNNLLFDGIGTSKVVGGKVQLERPITTSQTNAAGAADDAYLDVTTMLTLMYLRYSFRNRMLTRYPRHKLANDGTRFAAGQAVMTPKLGKAEALGWFRENEELGLVEGFDQFKTDLVVERNGSDPNRLDFLLPPDLMNQLIVTAAQIAFRL